MEGEARCVATRKALHGYVEKMKGNAWVGQLRIDKGIGIRGNLIDLPMFDRGVFGWVKVIVSIVRS